MLLQDINIQAKLLPRVHNVANTLAATHSHSLDCIICFTCKLNDVVYKTHGATVSVLKFVPRIAVALY